ncbi:hypothetical protein C8R44DRAFT_842288 [Mycena epipterygia]|nr:hypothetical protein C8R44DRAFT_842288 [Mycena epipterygia]
MPDYAPPPLDENFWDVLKIDNEGLAFFKFHTGIHDSEALKKHIVAVHTKAYEVHGYHCIRSFLFTRTRISHMAAYPRAISLGRKRQDAILLDLGCCFGTDIRKVAQDGFPTQNLIASDLRPEFWNLGHELFRFTPETFPVSFLQGDVFDRNFLALAAALSTSTSTTCRKNPNVTSLTPLNGHISVLHTSYFFHLFNEQKQTEVAHLVAGLLSPLPGSMVFGEHVGKDVKGIRPDPYMRRVGGEMFCHSPESWVELWESILPKGSVRVEARLKKRGEYHPSELFTLEDGDDGIMDWSCTRV